jgi:hypothetical protein
MESATDRNQTGDAWAVARHGPRSLRLRQGSVTTGMSAPVCVRAPARFVHRTVDRLRPRHVAEESSASTVSAGHRWWAERIAMRTTVLSLPVTRSWSARGGPGKAAEARSGSGAGAL